MKAKIREVIKDFSVVDWVILGLLVSICFVCFQHLDILHTGGSSISYLNGHILDFYDYNATTPLEGNAYMPTTYIIFALWNIPIRIFGLMTESTTAAPAFVRMWYKLGTTVFYLATAYLIFKICEKKGVNRKNAIMAAFVFMSNPIALFSQFIFGQYDIITAFFIVLGIYFYIQKKDKWFILSFAVAITCKYFALLVFVPLLLLREKNVWKIIQKMCGVASVFVLETLVYIGSRAFREGVFGFKATGYIFNSSINNGFQNISLVLVVWVLLCAFAYFKKCDNETEEFYSMIHFLNMIAFVMFGLSFWHPQWLLIAVPFWTLCAVFHEKSEIFFLLDLVISMVYFIYITNFWIGGVDQNLFSGGIFRRWVEGRLYTYFMCQLYRVNAQDLLFSAIVAIMLVYAVFSDQKKLVGGEKVKICDNRGVIRLRYLGGILWYLVPAFVCLFLNLSVPDINYETQGQCNDLEVLWDGTYEQHFVSNSDSISKLSVYIGTYQRSNDFELTVQILDENDSVLCEQKVNTEKFKDVEYSFIDLDKRIDVTPGEWYTIRFVSSGTESENVVALYRGDNLDASHAYVLVNGEQQAYNYAIKVYE